MKICLSTHIDIFDEKKIQNIFWRWGLKSQKNCLNFVKSPEKFIYDFQSVGKCLIGGALTNFCRKVPFWGLY